MHQLFILASRQLLHPIIQTFVGCQDFQSAEKNPQRFNVVFLVQNRRNFTLQKLPVIQYTQLLKTWALDVSSVGSRSNTNLNYKIMNVLYLLYVCRIFIMRYYNISILLSNFQRSTIINKENMIQVQNNINICEMLN